MSRISQDINQRIQRIIAEQNEIIMERQELIFGIWVARVAQEHLVMFGPGGTAKSFVARNTFSHIADAVQFETALDETKDPGLVFGPPDIKAMVEQGKSRVVTTGMLPEATDAFIDEIMNANSPTKHSLQPILNERIFHNNGMPHVVPLRWCLAGTNKNNADTDPDLAPFFDRLHLRYSVDYVRQRDNQASMVTQAIARMTLIGRGTGTTLNTQQTTVTVAELDVAHKEALALEVDDPVMNMFLDLREELQQSGILISDRRMVEGMAAVLANAWVHNHETVMTGDLSILTTMWWSLQEHAPTARGIILASTNPSEKAAMDLLDELDKIKAELTMAETNNLDAERKTRLGIESVRNTDKIIREAHEHRQSAVAAGASTTRLDETIGRAEEFKIDVGRRLFGLDPNEMVAMTKANA
jgi:MoxR-like ATPase